MFSIREAIDNPRQEKNIAADIPQHLTDKSACGKHRGDTGIHTMQKKENKAANPHSKTDRSECKCNPV